MPLDLHLAASKVLLCDTLGALKNSDGLITAVACDLLQQLRGVKGQQQLATSLLDRQGMASYLLIAPL
jgi:hypothetical protein